MKTRLRLTGTDMLFTAATALFLLAAVPMSAQLWNAAGSTGILDEASLGLYEFSGPSLQFRAGTVGTIVARYPIVSDITHAGWGETTIVQFP